MSSDDKNHPRSCDRANTPHANGGRDHGPVAHVLHLCHACFIASAAIEAPFPRDLVYKLKMWTKQISEQPSSRVAPGIASAALRLHEEIARTEQERP